MREIKFRAWDGGQNKYYTAEEMAKDQLTLLPTGKFINVNSRDGRLSQVYGNMIPEQFIGLSDKNGKEIYEGDILRDKDGHTGEVKYIPEHAAFIIREVNPHRYNSILCGNGQMISTVIIGNIHENPELMESK